MVKFKTDRRNIFEKLHAADEIRNANLEIRNKSESYNDRNSKLVLKI